MRAQEIVLFESSDGAVTLPVEVDHARNEVWLNRRQMATLFGRDVKTIGKHINNALREELADSRGRVVAKFATTAADGKIYHPHRQLHRRCGIYLRGQPERCRQEALCLHQNARNLSSGTAEKYCKNSEFINLMIFLNYFA